MESAPISDQPHTQSPFGLSRQGVQAMAMTSPKGLPELYERHPATAYRVALRVSWTPADAEECGDGGETEHRPRNPAHFSEKL
jgi:hypothetical protein